MMPPDTKPNANAKVRRLFTSWWFNLCLIAGVSLLTIVLFNQRPVRNLIGVVYRSVCSKDREFATSAGKKWGIDLSHHQKSIDWALVVKHNKPDFIFLKSTEGKTHIDTRYRGYAGKARLHGIPVGAYHFFSYSSSGYDQARHFITHARLEKGDLYPVLDVEFRKSMNTRKWITREIGAFCREIEKEYGVYPIIYCECDFKEKYLKNGFEDSKYWISDLHREPRCEYLIWQYTDKGDVKGIGKIDNNLLRKGENLENYRL